MCACVRVGGGQPTLNYRACGTTVPSLRISFEDDGISGSIILVAAERASWYLPRANRRGSATSSNDGKSSVTNENKLHAILLSTILC